MKNFNALFPSILLASGCPHYEAKPVETPNEASFVAPILARVSDMEQLALSGSFIRAPRLDSTDGFRGFFASRPTEGGREGIMAWTNIRPEGCVVAFEGTPYSGQDSQTPGVTMDEQRWRISFSLKDSQEGTVMFKVIASADETLECIRRRIPGNDIFLCTYGATGTAYESAKPLAYGDAPELNGLSEAMTSICEDLALSEIK